MGVRVAEEVARRIEDEDIEVRAVSFDGLNLFDCILGFDRLVVIDAILVEGGGVGDTYRMKPEKVREPSRSAISPHHFDLATTLEIGKRLFPGEMPAEVVVFAVGTGEVGVVGEEMSAEVERAVPRVVSLVLEEVARRPSPAVDSA